MCKTAIDVIFAQREKILDIKLHYHIDEPTQGKQFKMAMV